MSKSHQKMVKEQFLMAITDNKKKATIYTY